jgi:hypothetical protein
MSESLEENDLSLPLLSTEKYDTLKEELTSRSCNKVSGITVTDCAFRRDGSFVGLFSTHTYECRLRRVPVRRQHSNLQYLS